MGVETVGNHMSDRSVQSYANFVCLLKVLSAYDIAPFQLLAYGNVPFVTYLSIMNVEHF